VALSSWAPPILMRLCSAQPMTSKQFDAPCVPGHSDICSNHFPKNVSWNALTVTSATAMSYPAPKDFPKTKLTRQPQSSTAPKRRSPSLDPPQSNYFSTPWKAKNSPQQKLPKLPEFHVPQHSAGWQRWLAKV